MPWIFRLLFVIACFGGFVYYMERDKFEAEREAQRTLVPYKTELERYLTKKSVAKHRIPAYGKVVFVEGSTKQLGKFSDYPVSSPNQPNDPREVDSVVLHNCVYAQVGSYSNGSRAMQHVCDFTVIEVSTGTWSHWGEFRGSMPRQEISRKRGSTSDENGGKAIYAFIEAGGIVQRASSPK